MNIQPISVTEFRSNMKKVLDEAKDKVIYISRNWEVYELKRVDNYPTTPKNILSKLDTMLEKNTLLLKGDDGFIEVGVFNCCKEDTLCKHWQWDGLKQVYFNIIIGEERAVE